MCAICLFDPDAVDPSLSQWRDLGPATSSSSPLLQYSKAFSFCPGSFIYRCICIHKYIHIYQSSIIFVHYLLANFPPGGLPMVMVTPGTGGRLPGRLLCGSNRYSQRCYYSLHRMIFREFSLFSSSDPLFIVFMALASVVSSEVDCRAAAANKHDNV